MRGDNVGFTARPGTQLVQSHCPRAAMPRAGLCFALVTSHPEIPSGQVSRVTPGLFCWPVRRSVMPAVFQAVQMGSTPIRATAWKTSEVLRLRKFKRGLRKLQSGSVTAAWRSDTSPVAGAIPPRTTVSPRTALRGEGGNHVVPLETHAATRGVVA